MKQTLTFIIKAYLVVYDDEHGGAHNLPRMIFLMFAFQFQWLTSTLFCYRRVFPMKYLLCYVRLGHALARPRNANLDVQSVGEHCVVHYIELALAGGCPPPGTHDQPIVDVDV